ncbi:YijD family membrane protein [Pectobacteriaceae bacterium CE70]|uniref:YijD family membrane protein n=1 Tax=Brenneria uluponensis TaxID=3057057 RepID=UPI0028EBC647|nr:YijD family membrane protein [Brenneria ulupoensis]WJV62390.1 YijD family membrane protein [Pectobacteriaceae bacterium C52]WJV66699.1 YijD family membrane protein [Pectobacteriaceae bacterium CE70]WJY10696.1 YijD family membrane protein [Pectobacteriaceae bacterium C80]
MAEQVSKENGTLVLALVAGLSVNGAFAALFSSVVPFSIFPPIALVLSVYCLHQHYMRHVMPQGIPLLAAGCFLLGLLLYSAILRAEYPQIGSNFVPSILCVVLALWLVAKLRARKAATKVNML